jgi:uncharacterized membrane protein
VTGRPAPARLRSLDWLRGVAVILMMLWHSVNAWTRPEDTGATAYTRAAFIGGWAAPLFLFLAGVSVALAGSARVGRGVDRATAARGLFRRGGQIFLIGVALRLPSLFSPTVPWTAMFTPDILHVLGLGMMTGAMAWVPAQSSASRLVWIVLPAVVLTVVVTPLVATARWPASLSPYFEAYFRANGHGVFSVLPWVVFVFAGVWAGASMASSGRGADAPVQIGAVGLALIGAGAIGSRLPSLFPTEFWTTSASWLAIRIGIVMATIPVAAWVVRVIGEAAAAPVVLLGQTSMFVYVVHLQLTYGWRTSPMTHALDIRQALVGAACLTVFMTILAVGWRAVQTRRLTRRQSPLLSRP